MAATQEAMQQAYVLHMRPYRETSAIVDLLYAEGRISAVAKGVRGQRKSAQLQRASLQPFQRISCLWSGRSDLKSLLKIEADAAAQMLNGDALFSGLYINELLSKIYHGSAESEFIFKLYEKTIAGLSDLSDESSAEESYQSSIQATLREFEFSLLEKMGYGVNFDCDASSGAAISADNRIYCYRQELGFVQVNEESSGDNADVDKHFGEPAMQASQQPVRSLRLTGEAIVAIHRGVYQHVWQDKSALRNAKRLSRVAFAPLLGDKTLETRRLFQ